jgi:hypothetical protein
MHKLYKVVRITVFLFIICTQFASSQQITDKDIHEKTLRLNTWQVKEVSNNGYIIAVEYPYNLGNFKRQANQYISIWAAIKPYESSPMNIAITLPDNITDNQLAIGFSNSLIDAAGKQTETYRLNLAKYMSNNNTREASLPNGMLNNKTDIFKRFMTYKYVYLLFSDSLGAQRIKFSLSFFRTRYNELTKPAPTYFTGNPADTAFTAEEKQDKPVFDDGSIPSPWDIAGISNAVRFKHFFKYLRYLMKNEKTGVGRLDRISDLL